MSTTKSMSWIVQPASDGGSRVLITGGITEESDLSAIAALGDAPVLRIDLGGVEVINSCGVREWIRFVNALDRSGRPLELERCSPAIVRQLNMISNFMGRGRVRSVLAPYFCEACHHEELRELDLPAGASKGALAPIASTIRCPKCAGQMDFDDLAETYLGFVTE